MEILKGGWRRAERTCLPRSPPAPMMMTLWRGADMVEREGRERAEVMRVVDEGTTGAPCRCVFSVFVSRLGFIAEGQ